MRADLYNGSTEYAGDEAFFFARRFGFSIIHTKSQAGDKLYPKGLNGSKKVNRVFIDKKVDRQLRDEWPLLVDGNDTVLWLPNLMKSNVSQLKQTTGQLLRITFSRKRL
ncbi:tRNA lysidine(34) synthetase TilS [Bacillus sp. JCM 19041]|uniref:tRNA lysidine(34) synthetase TilS n=1 Tax=Bacillus sp. JCM 19041 TaxID=1460637 RepID=UPI00336AC441